MKENKPPAKKKRNPAAKKLARRSAAQKAPAKKTARKVAVATNTLARIKKNDPAIPLPKFVERINNLLPRFLPVDAPTDGRITEEFTVRNVRAYQNRGIIDAPEREGKGARYRYRHLLQALAARKLLVGGGLKIPQIVQTLADRENNDLEKLLKHLASPEPQTTAPPNDIALTVGPWARVQVVPGLELNVARGFRFPGNSEAKQELMRHVRQALQTEFKRRRQTAMRKDKKKISQ